MARKPVKTEVVSDKAEKFRKVARQRGAKVVTAIRALAKTSRRGGYEYTEEQIDEIFRVLSEELDKARNRYTFGAEEGSATDDDGLFDI